MKDLFGIYTILLREGEIQGSGIDFKPTVELQPANAEAIRMKAKDSITKLQALIAEEQKRGKESFTYDGKYSNDTVKNLLEELKDYFETLSQEDKVFFRKLFTEEDVKDVFSASYYSVGYMESLKENDPDRDVDLYGSTEATPQEIISTFPKFLPEDKTFSYLTEVIFKNISDLGTLRNRCDEEYFISFFESFGDTMNKDVTFDFCKSALFRLSDFPGDRVITVISDYITRNLDDFLKSMETDNKLQAFYYLAVIEKILLGKQGDDRRKIELLASKLEKLFVEKNNIIMSSRFPVMSTFPKQEKIDYLVAYIESGQKKSWVDYLMENMEGVFQSNDPANYYKKLKKGRPEEAKQYGYYSKIREAYIKKSIPEIHECLENFSEYDIAAMIKVVDNFTDDLVSEHAVNVIQESLQSESFRKVLHPDTTWVTKEEFYYMIAPGIGADHKNYNGGPVKIKNNPNVDSVTYYDIRSLKKVDADGEVELSELTAEGLLKHSGIDTSKISNGELYAFQYTIRPEYRYGLQQRFNIDLSQLSVRTQYNLIHFFIESEEKWPELLELLDICGNGRNERTVLMKIFNGLPIQKNLKKLLRFAKNDPEAFREFIATYAHIVDSGENLFEILNTTENSAKLYEMFPKIKNKYIDKANDLFEAISDKNTKRGIRDVIAEAKSINLEMISVATISFECKVEGIPLSFDDFAGMERRVLQGNEMSLDGAREIDSYMDDMARIYEENITNKDKVIELIPTFKARAEDINSEFHVLKLQDKIVAFIVFTKNPNGTVFASGLNVNSGVRGSGIGDVMMRETILKKMKEADVVGSVVGKKEVAIKYLRDGAVMYNPIENKGDINLTIVWSDDSKDNYVSKNLDSVERMLEFERVSGGKVKVVEIESQEQIPFELTSEENGYVITRIFKPNECPDKKMRVVFEKRFVGEVVDKKE